MQRCDYRLVALFLCCCCGRDFPQVRPYSTDETSLSPSSSYPVSSELREYERCENLHPQESIRLKYINGLWYVIEILLHRPNDGDRSTMHRPARIQEPTCPTVNLKYPARFDMELNLYWSEDEGDLDFRFNVNETQSPGKWESAGAQTGSLSLREKYVQFAGTVFVRKAVRDHMVLTFCSPGRQLYSLVVGRNRTLDVKDLRSIKNQMDRIKLPVWQTKLECRDSSAEPNSVVVWLIAALSLTLIAALGVALFRAVK